jgi:hypothetical protein
MTIEFVQILQDMLGDLRVPEPVEVKLFGDDFGTLESWLPGLSDKLKKMRLVERSSRVAAT